ncbi:type III PLP-dependent enzyme domain-containing protein [Treponema pectinovorum]|uniref:pyridoxal-dependent decarboxylase n=1 Tax=Treponema pectinovorum TaxID=164 RepID=UPI00164ED49B|nr:pyridoxal-dependent decarboxylase [Treponema pectinovorum]
MKNLFYNFEELKTPCFIFDEGHLFKNYNNLINTFKNIWGNKLVIGYSVKTNSLPWVLCWMREHGALAEVVSEDEYYLARKIGFPPKNIIYNGPIKGKESLLEALNSGAIVNLDSFSEIEFIREHAQNHSVIWNVGLRINFDLESSCPSETIMGNEPGRFGFNIENGSLDSAIYELGKINNVRIVGLHAHHSTKTKSLNVFRVLCAHCCRVSEKIKNEITYIDIGGCFFGDKPNTPTYDDYAKLIKTELNKSPKLENCSLILEPGTALIATAFSYLVSVIDKKDCKNKRILTTDGSLIHIDPLMHGIRHHLEIFSNSNKFIETQILAGFTCVEKDRLAQLENEKELELNDRILFKVTGAYTISMSPLFIQNYPIIYELKNGNYHIIRNRWTVENFMQNCEVF